MAWADEVRRWKKNCWGRKGACAAQLVAGAEWEAAVGCSAASPGSGSWGLFRLTTGGGYLFH